MSNRSSVELARRTAKPESAEAHRDKRRRISQGFAVVAAIVGLLVGITSLTDWFERKLDRPQPRPPTEIDTRVHAVELRSAYTPYDEYLSETNQSVRGLTEAERKEQGLVFDVRVRFKGGLGERFSLRSSLYDATDGRRLSDPIYNQTAVDFVPAGQNHARTWPIWVPYPPRTGRFFLRATLTDRKEQPVDEQKSRTFRVTRVPPLL
jgi:hypothetical protein